MQVLLKVATYKCQVYYEKVEIFCRKVAFLTTLPCQGIV